LKLAPDRSPHLPVAEETDGLGSPPGATHLPGPSVVVLGVPPEYIRGGNAAAILARLELDEASIANTIATVGSAGAEPTDARLGDVQHDRAPTRVGAVLRPTPSVTASIGPYGTYAAGRHILGASSQSGQFKTVPTSLLL
jgi:hypothetical protein